MVELKIELKPENMKNSDLWHRAACAKTGAEAVAIILKEGGGNRMYIPTLNYVTKNAPCHITVA
jgi:hypothetical protein